MKVKPLITLLLFLLSFSLHSAQAGFLDFNYLDPSQLGNLIPQNVADETIKMFAIYACHRPYSGATSILRSNSLDLNLEATLVKLGDGLIKALNADGIKTSTGAYPAVPWATINLRKGFSENFDIGVSILSYKGQGVYGGDLKFVLHDEEEGPSYALRLGYTYINVPYAYVVHTNVINPELVMSQKLNFAEPYLGVGFRYFNGGISVPVKGIAPILPDFNITKSGSGTDQYAFTGVYFRILGAQGLRLGMEGSFDLSGYHTMGGVFGFGF